MRERNEKILALYASGMKIKDIASDVGMAANSVGQVLKKMGIARPAKPQKKWRNRPDVADEVLARLWKDDGLCASQIAERTGLSRRVVDQRVAELGLSNAAMPRHRYDGIGGINGPSRRSSGRAANYARRT